MAFSEKLDFTYLIGFSFRKYHFAKTCLNKLLNNFEWPKRIPGSNTWGSNVNQIRDIGREGCSTLSFTTYYRSVTVTYYYKSILLL